MRLERKFTPLIFFREKYALLDVISGFENELAGIQQAIKQLTNDRDQITESYHSVSPLFFDGGKTLW